MLRSTLAKVSLIAASLVLSMSSPICAQVEESLDEALNSFRAGNFNQAHAKLEELFKGDPTNDAILDLLDRNRIGIIFKMVSSDDSRLVGAGLRLLELRRSAVKKKISDSDQIQAKIASYLEADAQERLALKSEIAIQMGRNAAVELIEHLGAANVSVRADAMLLASEIGLDAVPVLIAVSKHPNALVRSSVAKLLGSRNLRHPSVAGTLASMAASDADATVKASAAKSLGVLNDTYGKGQASALEYHYKNALRYYLLGHTNPYANPYYDASIYELEGESLNVETVAHFQLSDRMAEQALKAALAENPNDLEARALLACVDAAQLAEYQMAQETFGESDPDLKALLDSQSNVMNFVRRPRLLSSSAQVLNEALEMALDHKNNVVAQALIEVMDRTGRRGASVLPSLNRSISETPSRAVRVRAAIALSKWSSQDLSDRVGSLVVSVLSEAVVNSGIRTVHSIIGDPQTENRFGALFADLNLDSFANSKDVAQGLVRADKLPPDLLVIDETASSGLSSRPNNAAINFFVNQIRGNARTADIPIVVLVSAANLEKAKNLYADADRKVVVLPNDSDATAFRTSVLDPHFKDKDDAKARALNVAKLAAEALDAISKQSTNLPLASSVDKLTQVIENRPDVVRIPCLGALGNLRAQASGSIGAIAQVFAASDNSTKVREAAMLAVAKILDGSGQQATADLLKIITDGMASNNLSLREASFIAYSAAGAPSQEAIAKIFSTTAPDGGAIEEEAGSNEAEEDDTDLDDTEEDDTDEDDDDLGLDDLDDI